MGRSMRSRSRRRHNPSARRWRRQSRNRSPCTLSSWRRTRRHASPSQCRRLWSQRNRPCPRLPRRPQHRTKTRRRTFRTTHSPTTDRRWTLRHRQAPDLSRLHWIQTSASTRMARWWPAMSSCRLTPTGIIRPQTTDPERPAARQPDRPPVPAPPEARRRAVRLRASAPRGRRQPAAQQVAQRRVGPPAFRPRVVPPAAEAYNSRPIFWTTIVDVLNDYYSNNNNGDLGNENS